MANSTRKSTRGILRSHPQAFSHSFASSSSTFSTSSSPFFQNRSLSPSQSPSLSAVRFSIDNRSISSSRSISVAPRGDRTAKKRIPSIKSMCMCSPTSHPGSFRCSLHKNKNKNINNNSHKTVSYPSNRLNARRSAMTNSLVRIGTVEGGDLVKRALSALIRPSSHQQRRRTWPSRLCVMTRADDFLVR